MSGVAGFVCVLVAVTMYLIGDLSHLDAAAAKTMAIETTIRKGTPPGSVAIGSECSKQLDCVSGSVCARFNGVLRCYLPCEPDGSCPAPGRCGKIGRDMVCVQ